MSHRRSKNGGSGLLRQVLAGIAAGGVTAGGALALFAALMVRSGATAALTAALATAAVCLGSFSAGYVTARTRASGGLLCGGVCGALCVLILAVLCAVSGVRTVSAAALIRAALILLAGCIGGMLGLRRAAQPHRHRA
jgi:putative membrane protein (TIGR04086 family)